MLYNIAQMEGPCWGHFEGLLPGLVMLLAVVVGVIGSFFAMVRREFRPPTRSIPPPWVLVCSGVVLVSGITRDVALRDAPETCSGGHWVFTPWAIAIAAWLAFANVKLLPSPAGAILWVSGTVLPIVLVIVINVLQPEVEPITYKECRWVLHGSLVVTHNWSEVECSYDDDDGKNVHVPCCVGPLPEPGSRRTVVCPPDICPPTAPPPRRTASPVG